MEAPSPPPGRSRLLVALPVLAAVLAAYMSAMDVYFRGDDFTVFETTFRIAQDPLALGDRIFVFFRPTLVLTTVSDYLLFGTNVVGFNAVTVAIHLVDVALLLLLVWRISGRAGLAAAVAVLWGTSPLYSEVTTWAMARSSSLLLGFMLLALLLLVRRERLGPGGHGLLVLLMVGAMGSKESWVILPPLAVVLLVLVLRRPVVPSVRALVPGFVLVGLYAAVFILPPLLGRGGASPLEYSMSASLTPLTLLAKMGRVLASFLWLGGLGLGADMERVVALVAVLGLAGLALWRSNRLAIFGFVFLFLALLPTAHIPFLPSRYNYLPQVGFWIAMVATVEDLLTAGGRRLGLGTRVTAGLLWASVAVVTVTQAVVLQGEIDDHRAFGAMHAELVELWQPVKEQMPVNQTVVLVDQGRRNAALEYADSLAGLPKVVNAKPGGLWEIIYFTDLANFAGDPLRVWAERVQGDAVDEALAAESVPVLFFTDAGFRFDEASGADLRAALGDDGELPPRMSVVRLAELP